MSLHLSIILISTYHWYQSLNVVECPEFRQLVLFLREDLREEDIPRRDKIRSAIMKAWYAYYKVLKDELQVSLEIIQTEHIQVLKIVNASRH